MTAALGLDFSIISKRDFRLAPRGLVPAMRLSFVIGKRITDDLHTVLTTGCRGAPPGEMTLHVPRHELDQLRGRAIDRIIDTKVSAQVNWCDYTIKILGLQQ